jgi:hypothetical protein
MAPSATEIVDGIILRESATAKQAQKEQEGWDYPREHCRSTHGTAVLICIG